MNKKLALWKLKKRWKELCEFISLPLGRFLIRHVDSNSGYHLVPDYYGASSKKMINIKQLEPFARYAKKVINARRTMLYYDRLFTLYQAVDNLKGISSRPKILEIGVYRGGSSYFLASISNDLLPQRAEIYCVDTFSGHSTLDINSEVDTGQRIGDFLQGGYENVKKYLSGYSLVTVLKGRIQDYGDFFKDMKFDLIHLDVDIYEVTYYSLCFYGDRTLSSGIILVDDYGVTTCPGVKKAVDQYLYENPGQFTHFELLTGQCLLVKQADKRP